MAIDFSKNDLVIKAGLSAEELTISQSGGAGIPAITITNFNRVGINTETPNEALTVVGNISAFGQLTVSSGETTTLFITNTAVGINTELPEEALTVVGNISASGRLIAANFDWERRFDYVLSNPSISPTDPSVSYAGIAPNHSPEVLSAWNITKTTYATDTGLIIQEGIAYNIAWDDRYTASY